MSESFTVRVGRTVVKVYHTPDKRRTGDRWTIAYLSPISGRKRESFKSKEDAEERAKIVGRKLESLQSDDLEFSKSQKVEYLALRALAAPLGVSLVDLVSEYADARKVLDGVNLKVAAEFYTRFHNRSSDCPTVAKCLEMMLADKKRRGESSRWMFDLESRCGRFARDIQLPINQVTRETIKAWLDSLDVSPVTRNNYRATLSVFFNWAKDNGHIHSTWNEFRTIKPDKVTSSAVVIFSVDEMQALLNCADPTILPLLAIGAFAGLRNAELQRLKWRHIHTESRNIVLDPDVGVKTGARVAPMPDNLLDILSRCKGNPGEKISSQVGTSHQLRKLAERAGIKWRNNGMRKSFISYRLALVKNAAQVADEAGNSPSIISRHYKSIRDPDGNVVTTEVAERWFSLVPVS